MNCNGDDAGTGTIQTVEIVTGDDISSSYLTYCGAISVYSETLAKDANGNVLARSIRRNESN